MSSQNLQNFIFSFFLISQLGLNAEENKNLPEPYNSIKVLNKDLHGWFSQENQQGLQEIIKNLSPAIVVEVGCWLGLSTIFIANQLSSIAKVYAIDHWLGQSYYTINSGQEIFSRLDTLYQQFLSNVIYNKLTEKIIPIRMKSLEAAHALDIIPKLVYIDASHLEEDVYNDVLAWYKKLAKGGIICGDDWGADSVRKGVTHAASELNLAIHANGNFWYSSPK